ncbi:MAG: pinensin family lanthipeptide [Cyclobacteriaceae bacterium]
MKKKMTLKDLSVRSFTTQLKNEQLQTAKGGEMKQTACALCTLNYINPYGNTELFLYCCD